MAQNGTPQDRQRIRELVGQLKRLPSPPDVAAKVLAVAMDSSSGMDRLAELISMDNALTVRVLSLANAANLGLAGKVQSVQQASSLLGLAVIQNVALSALIRQTLIRDKRSDDPLVATVWKHSLACAVAAGLLAERAFPRLKHAAFAAGLTHDCGRLALLSLFPQEYEELLGRPGLSSDDLLAAEEKQFGANHALLGGWLGRNWGLPEAMVECATLHHHDPEALDHIEGGPLPRTVALANLLAHEAMLEGYEPAKQPVRLRLAEALGLSTDELEEVRQAIPGRYAERAAIFELNGGELGFYLEAAERARQRLDENAQALESANVVLARRNKVLTVLAKAGGRFGECASTPGLLIEAARLLVDLPGGGCCVYRLFDDGRFEGVWAAGPGRLKPLRGRLDQRGELQPVGTSGQGLAAWGLPDGLAQALRGLSARRAAAGLLAGQNASLGLTAAGGYGIYPIGASGVWNGELLFELAGGPGWPAAPEDGGYPQLAGMLASQLQRLDLAERLQDRADTLTEALRKNQRIHGRMLQAERLAAVGQLAAGAAHEINNPLAIIYARTQLLELKETDQRKKDVLRLVMSQIERISGILRNLMDFARPAAPRFGEVQLAVVLERTADLVRTGLEKKGISLALELDPGLPVVRGDAKQLEQVFLNLLINAEQAMDRGGILALRAWADSDAGKVVVQVKDTGVGIPPENLKKIFDPFFTTKEEGKGTGLGLSTAYGIVLGHKGDISVQSEVGKGTAVRVSLPAATARMQAEEPGGGNVGMPPDAPAAAAPQPPDAPGTPGAEGAPTLNIDAVADALPDMAALAGATISLDDLELLPSDLGDVEFAMNELDDEAAERTALVIDPSPAGRESLARTLGALGLTVKPAASSREATELLNAEPFSAVVAAWPPRDAGRGALLAELAKRAGTTAVVLLTSAPGDAQARVLSDMGAVELTGPPDADRLLRIVLELLERHVRTDDAGD